MIMKKLSITLAMSLMTFLSVAVAAVVTGSVWVKVSDPGCNKCVMNDLERKCGKPNCGGFMASVDGTGKYVEGGYLQYNYKCKKCGHTITYRNK